MQARLKSPGKGWLGTGGGKVSMQMLFGLLQATPELCVQSCQIGKMRELESNINAS